MTSSRCSRASLNRLAAHAVLGLLLGVPALLLGVAPAPPDPEELWSAARRGEAVKVAELLARGADLNAEFREGGTAIMFATQRGHADVVRVLLEHGADVNAVEKLNHVSLLHFAIGSPQVVETLLSFGADVNAREFLTGQTPLWWAVSKGDLASAELLLKTGRLSRRALEEGVELATRLERGELVAAIRKILAVTSATPAWPQFRGAGAAGVADGEHPPVRFGVEPPANLAWSVAIPGLGHSSPVVWGDRIFLTTAVSGAPQDELRAGAHGLPMVLSKDRSPQSLRVLCLDLRTGKLLWERTAYEGLPKTRRSPKNSYASPTPATDGKHLVVMFGSHGLYCFDLDGKLLWQQDLGILDTGFFWDPEFTWGDASSPIIYKQLAIVQCDRQKDSFIAAFDLDTGKRRWITSRDELPTWSTPTVYQRGEVVSHAELAANGFKAIRGYDPDTGKELWQLKTGNSFVVASTPVTGLGLFLIVNGERPLKPIYAIRAGAAGDISLGDDQVANRSVAWSKKAGGAYYMTPLIYGEHLYVMTEGGVLTNYYLKNGEQIYRQRVGDSGATFSASPVAADGNLYLASETGEVYVVKEGIDYQLVAVNPVGEMCMATPAIAGGKLLVRTRSRLLAFVNRS